ncbi:jg593 [Pararge aegeria aegeria]|uniref:Jg593 protein n=1 Tax=Pararge aegeria aegeria TaxID=348720 RepID=A0A8S4QFQ7_9NEOP|nr:jg593 [Pararge aegeria aegeria]
MFTKYWTERGLQTLEDMLQKTAGRYCVEDQFSMADLCLVPQLYNAVSSKLLLTYNIRYVPLRDEDPDAIYPLPG